MNVYVQGVEGNPINPTTPYRARKFLESGKATVLHNNPFTIRLASDVQSQNTFVLGIDMGYIYTGFSAVCKEYEGISGTLIHRNDMSKKIESRATYRKNRRGRLRHREKRFDNRRRGEGWLAPSIKDRMNKVEDLIDKIKTLLPISDVVVEVATFDTQKMMNPEIKGIEYQQGELQGYMVREYLLEKWNRKCAYCGKRGISLEIEHIIPKSRGGTNRVSNLTLSCRKCNQKKGKQTAKEFGYPKIQAKAKESLKAAAYMNTVRRKLVDNLGCKHTYGYITKHNRIKMKLEKTHVNDAFVIAGGTTQTRCNPYEIIQHRRNNRKLQTQRKGRRPSIRRKKYPVQKNDVVIYDGKRYRAGGTSNKGRYVYLQQPKGENKLVSVKKVKLVRYGKGLQFIPERTNN